ncbi:hypothetical protein GH714_008704 [Hevea brasiliensis]|uniref:Uncharacterized protein n=1 Tax=Hevea brasiliensis TaxID=3981 RepID=A0A6A6M9K4_HEVBR|nr:hypothetical protein GH714_008704 [Hevea brasiliensis]
MKLKFQILSLTITSVTLQLINPSLQRPDSTPTPTPIPIPTPWPEQFHALIYTQNLSTGQLQVSNIWYDWPKGRNFYIRQNQLSTLIYDVEWSNGTSFYYTVEEPYSCDIVDFGVGIPRPDFLDGANYLGTRVADGFLCNVWEKVDFIWYYEDVSTKRPVKWDFSDGISTHVITFDVGAVFWDDSLTQAPAYCFSRSKDM